MFSFAETNSRQGNQQRTLAHCLLLRRAMDNLDNLPVPMHAGLLVIHMAENCVAKVAKSKACNAKRSSTKK